MTEYRKPSGGSRSGSSRGGSSSRSGPPRSSAPRGGSSRGPSSGGGSGGGYQRSSSSSDRPRSDRPYSDRSSSDRPRSDRPSSDRPRGDRPFNDRPRSDRPSGDRSFSDRPRSDRPRSDRPRGDRPRSDRPSGDRPFSDRPRSDRPSSDRPRSDRPRSDAPRPAAQTRSYASRSFDAGSTKEYDANAERPFSSERRPPSRGKREDSGSRSYDRPQKTYRKTDSYDRPARVSSSYEDKKNNAGQDEKAFGGSGAEAREARKGHEHVLYGVHAVIAALKNKDRQVTTIWVTDAGQKRLEDAWDVKRHPSLTIVDKHAMERLVPEGAVHQGLAIAVEPLTETFLSDIISMTRIPNVKNQLVVLLDEVTDPHNVGAVMRSMAAFGATALIVHKYNAPTVTGVLAKTATGAVEHVPMVVVTNLAGAMEELQLAGFYLLGMDENASVKLTDIPRDRHMALVFGAEGEGLRARTRSSCDAIASIPSFGPISSLNVSNAAAITLYEVTRNA